MQKMGPEEEPQELFQATPSPVQELSHPVCLQYFQFGPCLPRPAAQALVLAPWCGVRQGKQEKPCRQRGTA